jgi:BirA family biotin operon repressor/biotin-[acetyl-CoA-carboxylase] ligase
MELAWRLARRLDDAEFASGQALAAEFGVSRGAIWKAVRLLADRGLQVQALRGRGYRLPAPVEWLSRARIEAAIELPWRQAIGDLALLFETDSTNARLSSAPPPAPGRAAVCLAEFQTRGRGRRGRSWLMPPGAGICLSVAWQFERPPAALSALGPAAGLAARRALLDLGLESTGLKWPNDLVWEDGKLGGVLVELKAEGNGPAQVVVGVGINDRLRPELVEAILRTGGQQPVDLAAMAGARRPGRNQVAGAIVGRLVELFVESAEQGVDRMCRDWPEADVLAGREVRVRLADGDLVGVARGIAADGALLLETGKEVRRLTAGDVSVRLQT